MFDLEGGFCDQDPAVQSLQFQIFRVIFSTSQESLCTMSVTSR